MTKNTPKKRSKHLKAVALAFLLLGSFVFSFPYFTRYFYQQKAEQINLTFVQRMEEMPDEQQTLLYEKMLAYNRNLYETGQSDLVDAFSYEDASFDLKEFGFEEEMIGYISIPKLNLALPIYLGASKTNLRQGATHLSQTSLPIGGTNSNAVIAAHRAMSTADMFRYINLLEPGDEIIITNFKETLTYTVTASAIIQPDEIERILIQPDKDMVTLISCHPYGSDVARYVVYAERSED